MSLVPDYSSSSEEDEGPAPTPAVAAPASALSTSLSLATAASRDSSTGSLAKKPKKKNAKNPKAKKPKTKTTLFLPPEIQKLLEAGTSGAFSSSDDSDGGSELLAKQRQARRAAAKRPRPAEPAAASLAFLPAPKHEVEQPEAPAPVSVVESTEVEAPPGPQPEQYAYQYPDQSQYYPQAHDSGVYYPTEQEYDNSSKRARVRDRDLERALQQGDFAGVMGQITEVTGPSANAWQPPADIGNGEGDREVKVKASFWSTQQGARVSSAKPSRLQRQKHQLNQLAFDAKAREFELLDKKGASLKTKAETYAKYGW